MNKKYQNIFLSKDSLSFRVLSKANFAFITRQITQIQVENLEGLAYGHIKKAEDAFLLSTTTSQFWLGYILLIIVDILVIN